VEAAARDLAKYLAPTPLQYSRAFTDKARCYVHIKVESIQPIRAFKVRGALTKVMRLHPEER
jgi:threonine dehydratase